MFSHSELKDVHKFMSKNLSCFLPVGEVEIASVPILVGQPVKLCNEKAVLRTALSAPQVININEYDIESELSKDRIVLKKLELISKYYDQLIAVMI